jgi:hypothetical protein
MCHKETVELNSQDSTERLCNTHMQLNFEISVAHTKYHTHCSLGLVHGVARYMRALVGPNPNFLTHSLIR